ncbi:MAG TPA: hypothetical protein VNW53_15715 [Phenylobacterium sp.]|nr:hypothetical protein [Phenylobacterium sp.]HXA40445.1 hypothetical protein [Phenylobacterium sp.]
MACPFHHALSGAWSASRRCAGKSKPEFAEAMRLAHEALAERFSDRG